MIVVLVRMSGPPPHPDRKSQVLLTPWASSADYDFGDNPRRFLVFTKHNWPRWQTVRWRIADDAVDKADGTWRIYFASQQPPYFDEPDQHWIVRGDKLCWKDYFCVKKQPSGMAWRTFSDYFPMK